MINGKQILCIIPARGGSKGLPRKNILPLLGKPLISWTIEQALACSYFDTVLVSTDDQEIADIAKRAGAEVPFLRPADLAADSSPVSDTILHAVRFFEDQGKTFDLLVLLEATSPLRAQEDLNNAIETMVSKWDQADCLVSVGEIHLENPFVARVVKDGLVTPFVETSYFQRQQLPKVFFPYGVIYASKIDTFIEHLSFSQPRTISYQIERWQNYEIDDIYDFACIEAILNMREKETS
jgi:CMP-N-acetylneuraminic acid synthetase